MCVYRLPDERKICTYVRVDHLGVGEAVCTGGCTVWQTVQGGVQSALQTVQGGVQSALQTVQGGCTVCTTDCTGGGVQSALPYRKVEMNK